MRPIVIVVPGRIDTSTGGYVYNRRMAQGLSQCGWSVEVRELDDSFPYPTPAALEQAARVLADLRDGTRVLVDGLALEVSSGAHEEGNDVARSPRVAFDVFWLAMLNLAE